MSTEKDMLDSMKADETSINILGDFLGYDVGKSPIDPESEWHVLFSRKVASHDVGVIAAKPQSDLNNDSDTIFVRKLFQQVVNLKEEWGGSFNVSVVAFVGNRRIVFFQFNKGNRDKRLDINGETIQKSLYLENLSYLKDSHIKVEADEFGFGDFEIDVDVKKVFRQELTDHFLQVAAFYRKKLSELITGSDLKTSLNPLVDNTTSFYIDRSDLGNLVQSNSFVSALSTVVDTIILRQLMRRFLEGYYGPGSFEVNGIALGVGNGTMDDAIRDAVNVAVKLGDERSIKKLNRSHNTIHQMSLFDDVFSDKELKNTSQITIEQENKKKIQKLSETAQEQFKLAYSGDLFAGSVAKVADNVETRLGNEFPEVMAKLWIDTSSGNYSFRYQDMPPESLEKQYEQSMSSNVQIELDHETKKPVVFYGDDKQEQKSKGAYYTDSDFVNYMVNETVVKEFDKRRVDVAKAVKKGNISDIETSIRYLLDLKIADFTVGGGSFLRGAFLKLSEKYNSFANLNIPSELFDKYPMFAGKEDSQFKWEKYILENMLYGVDIDYKAIIIASLTLTLSSLKNRPKDTKLPQLVGYTLINQNALINAVPYYRRQEVFGKYSSDIAKLIKLKKNNFTEFDKLRRKLQSKVIAEVGDLANRAKILKIEAIELNLPEIFFNEDGSLKEHGGLDIIIGNPPWEIWKPNSDEFFGPLDPGYLKLNKRQKTARQKELIAVMPSLARKWDAQKKQIEDGSRYFRDSDCFKYQRWVVNGRKTSADINLYKIALERFTQLGNNHCHYSILVPDNLATDAGSTGLRHLLFDRYNVEEFLSFDNGKGIFPAVHRSYKFAVLTFNHEADHTEHFKAFFYKQTLNALQKDKEKIDYDLTLIKQFDPEKLGLYEVGSKEEANLYVKLRTKYSTWGERSLITLVRDFDKTNDSKYFKKNNEPDLIPMYEGKYMNQFVTNSKDQLPEAISQRVVGEKVGEVYKCYRIAIRSIARATDKRSLIATLLPPFTTFANSLNGQKNAEDMDLSDKLFYLGFLNSYCLDYVLRKLITSNVNKIYLRQLPLPTPEEVDDSNKLVELVKELLKENKGLYSDLDQKILGTEFSEYSHDQLIAELNARIMIDFGLTRNEIINMMKNFESANHKEDVQNTTQNIINVYDTLKGIGK